MIRIFSGIAGSGKTSLAMFEIFNETDSGLREIFTNIPCYETEGYLHRYISMCGRVFSDEELAYTSDEIHILPKKCPELIDFLELISINKRPSLIIIDEFQHSFDLYGDNTRLKKWLNKYKAGIALNEQSTVILLIQNHKRFNNSFIFELADEVVYPQKTSLCNHT